MEPLDFPKGLTEEGKKVYLSAYLSVYLSAYLSVYLSAYLSVESDRRSNKLDYIA